jgi:hypothetical protein
MVSRCEPGPDDGLGGRVDDLLEAARRRDWIALDKQLGELVPGFSMGSVVGSRTTSL